MAIPIVFVNEKGLEIFKIVLNLLYYNVIPLHVAGGVCALESSSFPMLHALDLIDVMPLSACSAD